MKRLLIVVPSLGIGGVETVVRNLLRNIDKEFFYIELLIFKDEVEDDHTGTAGKFLQHNGCSF